MTWTYDATLPSAKDRVRLALGDTQESDQLRSDETINAMLAANSEAEATAKLAEGLATQYAREPDSFGSDGTSISWRDRVKTWMEIASRMRGVAAIAIENSASRVASRGDETDAEYLRPASWVWND